MSGAELERCKKSLRSILLANKGGVPAQKIMKEYSSLYEEDIPYRRFKFPSLERFLMSIPDVCLISNRGGQVVVEGVASHGTGHIEKLVQRTGNKKGGGGGWKGNQPRGPPPRRSGPMFSPAAPRVRSPPRYSQHLSAQTSVRSNPGKVFNGSAARGASRTFPPKSSQRQQSPRRAGPDSVVSMEPGSWEVKQTGSGHVNGGTSPPTIPTIEKPTTRDWELEITAVESSNEVWVSLRSLKEVKNQLETELLQRHLSSVSFNGGTMPTGNYFSAEVEPGTVRRVLVTKLDRINHMASCFLIDHGHKLEVPWNCLVPPQRQFWTVKAQAMKIQLSGFSLYHNVNVLEVVKKALEGRMIVGREENGQNLTSPLVRIVETVPPGDMMSIDKIIQEMKRVNLMQSPQLCLSQNGSREPECLEPAQLPGVEEFYDCVVSHVVGPAEIYLRSYHSVQNYLDLQHRLLAFYSGGGGRSVESVKPGLTVATVVGDDWFRARVLLKMVTVSRPKNVLVKLVDTGRVEVVSESSIKVLETEFFSLPVQAIKAELDGVSNDGEEAIVWLREFCRDKSLVGQVVASLEDRLSLVLYDTTRPEVDININNEVGSLDLASKKDI